ncbi:hypothetical protein AGRA3207_004547 [Actinomadura graeca]|uniref:Ketosynthase family 3 (KS3) domain-containing protein n=1 Tax=Actinomadura graeca TaxID=2750812 RepID=A0ABX8QX93_9ACTN|nr:hypothetical protein [Actinomadura graeca]QXJ23400.1 hypothetical protein AGRA3207_004547 [Actinomadura graeca]
MRVAIERALADAGLAPGDIDVVFADGAGVPALDGAEAAALREVFGPFGVPVTVPKAAYGRAGAAGGPLDVAAALLAFRDSFIPPTVNTTDVPGAYGLDLAREGRRAALRAALVLARGHGGFNSALVLTHPNR